jgi:hypothetical protein
VVLFMVKYKSRDNETKEEYVHAYDIHAVIDYAATYLGDILEIESVKEPDIFMYEDI